MSFTIDRQPLQHPMRVVRGDDLTITVQIFQADGVTPQDVSGWTGAAFMRAPVAGDGRAATVDTATLGATGFVLLRWPRVVTENLTPGDGVWDLELIDLSDTKQTPVGGALTVLADATY